MSCRISWLLCFTLTQEHSTWNTNWIRSEQYRRGRHTGDIDDQNLGEEMESCKFLLTDTEVENGRHRMFKFVMLSFDLSLFNDKLDYVFKGLKSVCCQSKPCFWVRSEKC